MNTKRLFLMALCVAVSAASAVAQIVVKADEPVGNIKLMNSVNNGPTLKYTRLPVPV